MHSPVQVQKGQKKREGKQGKIQCNPYQEEAKRTRKALVMPMDYENL